MQAARRARRDRRARTPRTRTALRDLLAVLRPLARPARPRCRIPSSPRSSSRSPATPRCGRRTARADAPGRLENLKELVRSMEEFETLAGFLEHVSLVMDADGEGGDDAVIDHDAARRQGARIRHRVPARLGGRPVPEPARARRERPRRARGGAPPRLCRPHPRPQARQDLLRLEPAHPRPLAVRRSRRASSTNCRRPHVDVVEADRDLWRLRHRQRLRRQPLRPRATRSSNTYATPGWQRAQKNRGGRPPRRQPAAATATSPARQPGQRLIEGELVAKSVDRRRLGLSGRRARLPPEVRLWPRSPAIDGNKLTIDFDKAGRKRVLDSFVERH